jgi:hypothetical protein
MIISEVIEMKKITKTGTEIEIRPRWVGDVILDVTVGGAKIPQSRITYYPAPKIVGGITVLGYIGAVAITDEMDVTIRSEMAEERAKHHDEIEAARIEAARIDARIDADEAHKAATRRIERAAETGRAA